MPLVFTLEDGSNVNVKTDTKEVAFRVLMLMSVKMVATIVMRIQLVVILRAVTRALVKMVSLKTDVIALTLTSATNIMVVIVKPLA